MEAEEERRWQQARTPAKPAFDLARWKERDYAESARWEQQQAYQRYRQGEWAEPQPQKSLWQKAGEWLQQKVVQPVQRGWNALTHPGQTLENALVQWGAHSPTGYNVIRGLASMTASMNDPERNPVTAAFGQALQDGIAGFSYGVHSTIDLARRTGSSLLKGDWEGVRRYGGALLEGTVKGWIWGSLQTVGHLAWGAIKTVTPIGLFETVPAWTNALQEARAGKRGGWDVALTSLFLMANLIGIAGGVNGIKTANEFRTFPDTLSPAAQSQYISLSTIEQIKVFNAARSIGASPAAVEFYLEQTARPGSPLADLPLADALKVSALGNEIIPFLERGELAPKPWTEYVPPDFRENVIPAFEGEEAIAIKLRQPIVAYRYWGGGSEEVGSPWLTLYSHLSPEQARSLLALPNRNLANHITPFMIPENTVIAIGKAASQVTEGWAGPYAVGGGIQIYVPDPSVLIILP
jgi:hypothetical protein